MQESLWLLYAGFVGSYLSNSPEYAVQLTYDDFAQLQPERAPSSWRGAMQKAISNRWVSKAQRGDQVSFQLTRFGKEHLSQAFRPLTRFQDAAVWTLLLLQPLEEKRQHYTQIKRLLEDQGAAGVQPSVYVWPFEYYSQEVVQDITAAGFLPCFLPFSPTKSQPVAFTNLVRNRAVTQKKYKEIRSISGRLDELIVLLSAEKKLHHKQKDAVGSMILSGLAVLQSVSWYDIETTQDREDLATLSRRITETIRLFLQQFAS